MKNFLSSALLLGALTATSALADNPNYSPGDLILFFQQENGPQTIYANLGNAAAVFRGAAAGATGGTNSVNFLNINSALTTAFGAAGRATRLFMQALPPSGEQAIAPVITVCKMGIQTGRFMSPNRVTTWGHLARQVLPGMS